MARGAMGQLSARLAARRNRDRDRDEEDEKPVRKGKVKKFEGFEVHFEFERETKGAVRYKEVDEDGDAVDKDDKVIGTLYLRKSAFDGAKSPKKLKVVIE
jgi:hypothetical protein